jgi:hypothetical protein
VRPSRSSVPSGCASRAAVKRHLAGAASTLVVMPPLSARQGGNGRSRPGGYELGKLGFLGGGCFADLRWSGVGASTASGVSARCSPWFPAGSGTHLARPHVPTSQSLSNRPTVRRQHGTVIDRATVRAVGAGRAGGAMQSSARKRMKPSVEPCAGRGSDCGPLGKSFERYARPPLKVTVSCCARTL